MILTLLALYKARSCSCLFSPGHTRSFDLCALGFMQFKAFGLVQVIDLQGHDIHQNVMAWPISGNLK